MGLVVLFTCSVVVPGFDRSRTALFAPLFTHEKHRFTSLASPSRRLRQHRLWGIMFP